MRLNGHRKPAEMPIFKLPLQYGNLESQERNWSFYLTHPRPSLLLLVIVLLDVHLLWLQYCNDIEFKFALPYMLDNLFNQS